MPDISAGVTNKHNLELSIFSNAPFSVGFLERILDVLKRLNAPFLASILGIAK